MRRLLWLTLHLLVLANSAVGSEEGKKLVDDSRRCLACFKCVHFAFLAGEEELGQKLLQAGVESGRRFLQGTKENKIGEEEAKEIAVAYRLKSVGPSIDFVLGRIYEDMGGDAARAIAGVPFEEWKKVAKDELRKRNASLLIR